MLYLPEFRCYAMTNPTISKEKPSDEGIWPTIGILLIIALSFIYDLVVIVFALDAAHDNFSRSDNSDKSVESALPIVILGMSLQLFVAVFLYANRKGRFGGVVLFGMIPLVLVAAFLFLTL